MLRPALLVCVLFSLSLTAGIGCGDSNANKTVQPTNAPPPPPGGGPVKDETEGTMETKKAEKIIMK